MIHSKSIRYFQLGDIVLELVILYHISKKLRILFNNVFFILSQVYMMYDKESPAISGGHPHFHGGLLTNKNHPWRYAFNLTCTFRKDADFFSPYRFGLQFDFRLSENMNSSSILQAKTRRALWIVSHCKTQSRRQEYVKRLGKVYPVDIFGDCGSKCPKVPDLCGKDIVQYKFYLSFENSICDDYITEKLFKLFRLGPAKPVAVVRGGGDYRSALPHGSFVNAADFPSPEALGKHLLRLEADDDAYMAILRKSAPYRTPEYNNDLSCGLCEYLNTRDPSVVRHYDIQKWAGTCRPPSDL